MQSLSKSKSDLNIKTFDQSVSEFNKVFESMSKTETVAKPVSRYSDAETSSSRRMTDLKDLHSRPSKNASTFGSSSGDASDHNIKSSESSAAMSRSDRLQAILQSELGQKWPKPRRNTWRDSGLDGYFSEAEGDYNVKPSEVKLKTGKITPDFNPLPLPKSVWRNLTSLATGPPSTPPPPPSSPPPPPPSCIPRQRQQASLNSSEPPRPLKKADKKQHVKKCRDFTSGRDHNITPADAVRKYYSSIKKYYSAEPPQPMKKADSIRNLKETSQRQENDGKLFHSDSTSSITYDHNIKPSDVKGKSFSKFAERYSNERHASSGRAESAQNLIQSNVTLEKSEKPIRRDFTSDSEYKIKRSDVIRDSARPSGSRDSTRSSVSRSSDSDSHKQENKVKSFRRDSTSSSDHNIKPSDAKGKFFSKFAQRDSNERQTSSRNAESAYNSIKSDVKQETHTQYLRRGSPSGNFHYMKASDAMGTSAENLFETCVKFTPGNDKPIRRQFARNYYSKTTTYDSDVSPKVVQKVEQKTYHIPIRRESSSGSEGTGNSSSKFAQRDFNERQSSSRMADSAHNFFESSNMQDRFDKFFRGDSSSDSDHSSKRSEGKGKSFSTFAQRDSNERQSSSRWADSAHNFFESNIMRDKFAKPFHFDFTSSFGSHGDAFNGASKNSYEYSTKSSSGSTENLGASKVKAASHGSSGRQSSGVQNRTSSTTTSYTSSHSSTRKESNGSETTTTKKTSMSKK